MFSKERTNILTFRLDYNPDEIEVACEMWMPEWESASLTDLHARAMLLANALKVEGERYNELYQRYEQLKAKLEAEINRGIDRAGRKFQFFEGNNPSKAEAMKARLEVYETFKRILLDIDDNKTS